MKVKKKKDKNYRLYLHNSAASRVMLHIKERFFRTLVMIVNA